MLKSLGPAHPKVLKIIILTGVAAMFFAMADLSARAGQYAQDFSATSVGDTNFGDGSQLFSTALGSVAQVQDDTHKELALTESGTSGVTSAFELPDLDPDKPIYAFSAKWNSQVYGDFPTAADGFSFSFGQLASSNLISGPVETGYGAGLSFGVQTFFGNNPGFYVRVNGATLAAQPFNPTTQWGNFKDTRHFFEVDWNYTNGLTVQIDGQMIFNNSPTYGFVPRAGDRFVWAAICGASNEEVRLDNIVVMTGGNLVQVPASSPYYSNQGSNPFHNSAVAFDGDDSTYWAAFSGTGYIGATVSNVVSVYALTSSADTGSGAATDPKTWDLDGSINNGTTWTARGSGGGSFVNREETRAWMVTNSTSFGAYRLNITANNGSASIALGGLRFYQFVPVAAVGWSLTSAPAKQWSSVVSSADGTKLAATAAYDGIYLSSDSGANWTKSSAPTWIWSGIAGSSDLQKLAAVNESGFIYISTDSGETWLRQTSVPDENWLSVATSEDGNEIMAGSYEGDLYIGGADDHWGLATNVTGMKWCSIASTGDGWEWLAAAKNGGIYHYSYFSGDFFETSGPVTNWYSIASSAGGGLLAAVVDNGGIYTASGGAAWKQQTDAPLAGWSAIATSSDGTKLAAAAYGSGIYMSSDSGLTWTRSEAPDRGWLTIAASADGTKLVAGNDGYFDGLVTEEIWTYGPFVPLPPVARTLSASPIHLTRGNFNGQVAPNYLPTSAWFEWGLTTDYGNITVVQNIGKGKSPVWVTAAVAGLASGATYHYRMVGLNNFGTNYGSDVAFTTPASNAFFNIALPGDTITASSANSPAGQAAAGAIDGTAATKYLNLDKLNTGFTVFPSVTNVRVGALGVISAEDSPERDPASFALYGSHDGLAFTPIASNAIPPFASRNAVQSFTFANTNTYLAYKLIFPTVQNSALADSMQIAQVEFLPDGDITSPTDPISLHLPLSASLNGVGTAAALLDRQLNQPTNKLVIMNYFSGQGPVVAEISPAAGASILKGFEFIGGYDDTNFPGRTPATITVKGSNDGTTFTTLASVNPATPAANMQIQGFSVLGNTDAYTQYSVEFGLPQSGTVLQIGELRLLGVTSTRLGVAASGNNLLLSWPVSGFVLEESTNLASNNWMTATNLIVVTNGQSQVSLPESSGNNFFRLKAQ